MALITTDDLKPYIAVDYTDPQKIIDLESLISSASSFITSYLKYDPEGESLLYRDIITLNSNKLALKKTPILTLTSLKLNDYVYTEIQPPGIEGENGTDFWIDKKSGILTFPDLSFHGGYKIECSYTIGYNPIPADLKGATCELVAWNYFKQMNQGYGVKSVMAGEGTTTYETNIPYSIRVILDNYL